MNRRTWMSWAAAGMVVCGCNASGQQSIAQSDVPRDAFHAPKGSASGDPSGKIPATSSGSGSDDIRLMSHRTGGGKIGEASTRVCATVNGTPILETELAHAIFPLQLVENGPDPRISEYKKSFVERLIDIELLTQDMNQRFGKTPGGKRTLEKLKDMAEREFEGMVRSQIKDLQLHSEDEYKAMLTKYALTYQGRRDFIERSMIADEYSKFLIGNGLEPVGHRQIYDYYLQHQDEFTPPVDTYEWEDIFLDFTKYPEPQRDNAQARAVEIVQKMRAGAKISELIEFDDGDARSRNGRGAGTHRGQIQPPEVEQVLVDLKEGEVGPLVVLPRTGIHIVRMVRRENAHELQPFDARIQKLIKEKMQEDIFKRERKRLMETLRRKAQIEYANAEGR
jgi:hypothetical protein